MNDVTASVVAVAVDDGDEEDPEKMAPPSHSPQWRHCFPRPSFPSLVISPPPFHYSARCGQLYSNKIAYQHRVSYLYVFVISIFYL